MEIRDFFTLILKAADKAADGTGSGCKASELNRSEEERTLEIQPLFGVTGPTQTQVSSFILKLGEQLTDQIPGTGIDGKITCEERDGAYFALVTLN